MLEGACLTRLALGNGPWTNEPSLFRLSTMIRAPPPTDWPILGWIPGHPEYLQVTILIEILVWNSFRISMERFKKKPYPCMPRGIVLGFNLKVEEKKGGTNVIGSSIQYPANEQSNIIISLTDNWLGAKSGMHSSWRWKLLCVRCQQRLR